MGEFGLLSIVERLMLALLVAAIASGLLVAFRSWHIRRAGRSPVSGAGLGRPTLLYFRSDACHPCVTQARYLHLLQQQLGSGLEIQQIDADRERGLADRFRIFTLPTTLIVDQDGAVKHINYGLTPTTKLVRQLENIL